jgi:hypothetical protein
MTMPKGWSWTGPLEATLHTGQSGPILSCGKPTGATGWEITVVVSLTSEGLDVRVDDETGNYTHGSYTDAMIPTEIIEELFRRKGFTISPGSV